ncbi:MAG: Stage IV sporulation protein FB, partial [Chlamydiae bacterium]|nr:Stage IV sporulation protein FB [Chlamydiota bacterium]
MISLRGKIPVTIHPVFFLVAAIIGFLYSQSIPLTLVWILVIMISVLFHEMGHALTAMAFGQKAKIELVGFGGLTHHNGKTLKPWQSFIVVLNGPLAGFLLFGLALFFRQFLSEKGVFYYGVSIAVYINLFWTIINLLPIQPLDGGKLLSITFEKMFGHRGIRLSYLTSLILATGFAILFFVLGAIIAGAIFFLFAFESYRAWSSLKNISSSDRDVALQEMLKKAVEKEESGQTWEAENILTEILGKAEKGLIHNSALEMLGKLYYERGDYERAFSCLFSIKEMLTVETIQIFHKISGMMEKWDIVFELSDQAYSAEPNFETALLNASSQAVRGDMRATLGWLMRARNDGAQDLSSYVQRP